MENIDPDYTNDFRIYIQVKSSPATRPLSIQTPRNDQEENVHSSAYNDVFKKSAGYKYYRAKKAESEKAKAAEEPEEQHESLVRSGRGKGYMCSGDQEANVPSAFKKNVVPRKTRSLTVTDNIVEEPVAVELAKSINTYAEWGQKFKGPVVKDPTIQSLLDLKKGSKASRLESLKQAKQEVGGEGSSATHNKYYEFENISATDSEATQDSYHSDTDEERDNETDDSDNSDMDLFKDEPKGDDDAADLECSVYTDAQTTSAVVYPEGNPKLTSYISGASEVPLGAYIDVQETNILLQEVFPDENAHHISSPPETYNTRCSNAVPSFHKRSHDHQDPPTNHEGEIRKKRQKDVGQSSTRSSRKDKAPMVHAQKDTHADQPQDQENLYVQGRPNTRWFMRKSRSADAAKRRTTWFDLLLKSDIDQNENHILGPSIMAIAKKLKELIQKDQLTIAYLEGVGLNKLKQ
ncbi:hypothetical protein Tco_0320423 [Tanacetum coccineum]